MNMVIHLKVVPQNSGNLLCGSATGGFYKRTQLHGRCFAIMWDRASLSGWRLRSIILGSMCGIQRGSSVVAHVEMEAGALLQLCDSNV